jgi:GT2 family glycosyltransferase
MTPPALAYIILVHWNGKDVTLDCLASLANVRYSPFRTLVVDNASTDGSVERIRSAFPEIEVLSLPENRRFAGGSNAGIRHALTHGAEFVVLLNNDTTVDAGFLDRMIEAFSTYQDTGLVAPKIYYHDQPNVLWYAGGDISFWTGTMRHVGIREPDRGQYDTSRETGYATGCCMLTTRGVIERIGLLDESYFMYTEDADWSMRARRGGYRVLYEPRAKVWHKISVSAGGHLSRFKLTHKLLSSYRFFVRYASWYHWLTFPWLSIMVNLLAAVRYVFRRTTA